MDLRGGGRGGHMSTHVVAVQVQQADPDEAADEVGQRPDEVPAQVQLVHVAQRPDDLGHHGDGLEAQVQTAFAVLRQLHAALDLLQGHRLLPPGPFGFLPLGHSGETQDGGPGESKVTVPSTIQ